MRRSLADAARANVQARTGVARALVGEAAVAREPPGPAEEHSHADPLALGIL